MINEYDETEIKIINATFEILQQDGFQKTTTKKVAQKAGVNEVTVFRKFENKENLVDKTKKYHLQLFIQRLEDIFDFTEDENIEDYLKNNFYELLNLSDMDFSVLKLAMEEVRDVPGRKRLIAMITDTILNKIEEFFKLQYDHGKIRDIDLKVLSVMSFSITFQSIVLWKIYNKTQDLETQHFSDNVLDALINGIKS